MKTTSLFLIFLILTLSGCSAPALPASPPAPDKTVLRWTPPDSRPPFREEAQSSLDALALCQSFVQEMSKRYPQYAPILSDADITYYEKHLSDPHSDLSALSAELAGTIVSLRQQVYLCMEETLKLDKSLPDGLEQFVRDFEARFHEIGWEETNQKQSSLTISYREVNPC